MDIDAFYYQFIHLFVVFKPIIDNQSHGNQPY